MATSVVQGSSGPFYDPETEYRRRQAGLDMKYRLSKLGLDESRETSSYNLMGPLMDREFAIDARKLGGNIAGRGLGASGARDTLMTEQSQNQATQRTAASLKHQFALEDINLERQYATESYGTLNSELWRLGAGNRSANTISRRY